MKLGVIANDYSRRTGFILKRGGGYLNYSQ
jgi:hypothetical protein